MDFFRRYNPGNGVLTHGKAPCIKQRKSSRRVLAILFTWFLLSWLVITSIHAENRQPVKIGVHPFLPATILLERFKPLADYLSNVLEQPVVVVISSDYEQHIKAAGEAQYDIAFLGPASYIKLVKHYGPQQLLARFEVNGRPEFRGAIVTQTKSDIKSLEELKGHSFAFGDRNSTMSTLIPEWMLKTAGVDLAELKQYSHLSNHNDVALGVLLERFDAGAVKEEVFQEYRDRGLKILSWTPAISEHLFISGPQVPVSRVDSIRDAMFKLSITRDGLQILQSMKPGLTGLVPVTDEDYENLRLMLAELAVKQ